MPLDAAVELDDRLPDEVFAPVDELFAPVDEVFAPAVVVVLALDPEVAK